MDSLKSKTIKLRKAGYSYSIIRDKTGVSKSTLSNWLNSIPFRPNQQVLNKIGKAKLKSGLFKHNQKLQEINEMRDLSSKELGEITKRDLWLLGIGLYLGEGGKAYEQVRFSNSNPEVIKIAIAWFKGVCNLENKNFVPYIHVYPDNNIKEALIYWSNITGIKKEQFGKIQIDRRTNKVAIKRKSLPHGTLHLQIRSGGNKEFGKRLHRRITGWIESSIEKINAGIV